jgi:dihydropteroate synthase
MGILNVTPDSFSDGGRFANVAGAVERGVAMVEEGADIIDLGGESTRPGAAPVPEEVELARVIPVIEALRGQTGALLSVDTRRTATARAALAVGADILNDISALAAPGMAELAAESGAGVVLMHMQGSPETMQTAPRYRDPVGEVQTFLADRMAFALARGVAPEQLCLDPGIGFGKTDEHNLALLRAIPELAQAQRPLLIGASRKSFIGRLLGRDCADRLAGSLAVAVFCALRGAQVLRVHDVKESCDALKLLDTLTQ